MRRRDFIAIACGTVAWQRAAYAQQLKTPVIGFLSSASPDGFRVYLDMFRKELGETGYVDDRNVAIEYRWAAGQYDRLPTLAAELVERGVSVIVATGGNPPAQAAKAATSTIPIVFISGGDSIAGGLVASFSRPGGNVTAVSWLATTLVPKRLDFLRRLVPNAAVIGVLVNPSFVDHELQVRELQEAAATIGQQIKVPSSATADGLDTALVSLVQQGARALYVANDPYFLSRRDQIIALAAHHALPAIYFAREFAVSGGPLSYGASLADANRQGGIYTGKVLKGALPADLPIWQPSTFELVINLKTAKALGIEVPPTIYALADEVIE